MGEGGTAPPGFLCEPTGCTVFFVSPRVALSASAWRLIPKFSIIGGMHSSARGGHSTEAGWAGWVNHPTAVISSGKCSALAFIPPPSCSIPILSFSPLLSIQVSPSLAAFHAARIRSNLPPLSLLPLRLLQPPLPGVVVLGVDPAFRTGCKLAVCDATGSSYLLGLKSRGA